jgi:hypothetical protein
MQTVSPKWNDLKVGGLNLRLGLVNGLVNGLSSKQNLVNMK